MNWNSSRKALVYLILVLSRGARRPCPPTPVITGQKRWPPRVASTFVSHRVPLGQISGSATVTDELDEDWDCIPIKTLDIHTYRIAFEYMNVKCGQGIIQNPHNSTQYVRDKQVLVYCNSITCQLSTGYK